MHCVSSHEADDETMSGHVHLLVTSLPKGQYKRLLKRLSPGSPHPHTSSMDSPATALNIASNFTEDGLYFFTVSNLSLLDLGVHAHALETLIAHLLETPQNLLGAYCSNPYDDDGDRCHWDFCPQPDVSGECARSL